MKELTNYDVVTVGEVLLRMSVPAGERLQGLGG